MKHVTLIILLLLSCHWQTLQAQDEKPDAAKNLKLLYPGGLYLELQKITPKNWTVVGREGNYVVYVKENPIMLSQTDYEAMPKENAGKEEAWAKKKSYPKPYEILIRLTPFPIEDYLAIRNSSQALSVSQETIASLGEKYQIETTVLTTKQYIEYSGDKLIADPNTGLYTATNSDEKNRLVMFSLEREKLLTNHNPTAVSTATPQYYINGYSVTIEYDTSYYKIFPEKITQETDNIVNAIKTILINQMQ